MRRPPEIPYEQQIEILSYLPSKSLARFNCVSKLWNHSFTSTAFFLHHSRSSSSSIAFPYSSNLIEIFPNDNDESCSEIMIQGFPIPLPPALCSLRKGPNFFFSNCCDGLVCICEHWELYSNQCMWLFSVRTKKFLRLPTKTRQQDPDQILLYNVNRNYTGFAKQWCSLGFDPVQRAYKVLRCRSRGLDHYNTEYQILTIGSSKSWTPIRNDSVPPLLSRGGPYHGSFCVDGVIYWIHIFDRPYQLHVACFDLVSREFRALEVGKLVGGSNNINYHENQCYLAPIKGCPTLFFQNKRHDEILQLTLENHSTPENMVWSRRIIVHSEVISSIWQSCFGSPMAGGSIVVGLVACIGQQQVDQEDQCSPNFVRSYWCYDLQSYIDYVTYYPRVPSENELT